MRKIYKKILSMVVVTMVFCNITITPAFADETDTHINDEYLQKDIENQDNSIESMNEIEISHSDETDIVNGSETVDAVLEQNIVENTEGDFVVEPEQIDESAVEEVHTITGFEEISMESRTYSIVGGYRPKLDELLAEFPKSLAVYLDGMTEKTEIHITYECVGEEYENVEGYYYQFNPIWDANMYQLSEELDYFTDVPYIAVFLTSDDNDGIAMFSVTSSSNEAVVYKFLITQMGLNSAAACGVMANIQHESAFNPKASGDNGTSYGICQWHNSRYTALKKWCSSNGYDYTTLTGQLYYLKYELSQNNSAYLYNGKTIYNYLAGVSNNASGAYSAGYYWCYYYEVPANRDIVAVTRGNLAKNSYWPEYSTAISTGMTISGANTPGTLTEGSAFSIKGVISSNTALTNVTVRVYNSAGEIALNKRVAPNTKSYDIHNLDSYIKFGTLSPGTYNYRVAAIDASGLKTLVNSNFKVSAKTLSIPVLTAIKNGNGYVKVSWNAVSGAEGYRVYRRENNGDWVRISTISNVSTLVYTDTTVESGKIYTYTVRACSGSTLSSYNKSGIKTLYLSTPKLVAATKGNGYVKVSWNAVSGATGYRVYRRENNGDWIRVSTISNASTLVYTDKAVKNGKTYTYTVRACNGSYLSCYDVTGKSISYK